MVWMGKYGFYDLDDVILRLFTLTTVTMKQHPTDIHAYRTYTKNQLHILLQLMRVNNGKNRFVMLIEVKIFIYKMMYLKSHDLPKYCEVKMSQ